eukprot:CAMPEP_0176493012 /NCGR_PEP_ID=MMETSP0200_2-20121128/9327_1 /TAXON_ID=947934 /ORGANISM="Chaetoceros sp., Strain GSL56" /LENGTH=817 /DNA_ID=CAMNT_0017890657 /DNA_START=251 /DNA_END=2704 /DNA_ORIENTATION=+
MNTRAPTNLHHPATPTLEDSVPDDELKITSKATTTNSSSHASISSQGSVSSRDDWSRDSSSMNGLGAKKKKVQDRPWKPARQYDAVLTDSVDVCGVNANVISPTKTCAASGESQNREKKMDDDDDDVSYDEGEDSDVDPTLSSRWSKQQPSSMEEVKQAHLKGIGLAAASRMERIPSVGQKNHDLGELPLTPVSKDKELKRKNHEQVRLEALKLLELANSTGESGQYIIKETYSSGTTSGSSKFKSMRVKGLERNSALSGMSGLSSALKERRQRGTYDRMDMDMDMDMDGAANDDGKGDVFTTNPVNSPIKGRLDDVRINDDVLDDDEELGPSGMEGRKTWGSRYSIDRHLSAVYGGLTSKQVLSKMDRDHYNDLNKNTSANNMFKTSPHEDEDDRWNVSNGKKAQQHKSRLWNTWIANVKDTFTYIVTKYESSSTAQWRSADHSSPKKGIFTGVAITNFLDRLSPRSRSDAVARGYGDSGSSFNWRNVNLADDSRDLPDVNFSANDDISFEKRQKRKRMFWLAVLLLSLVTLFTIVGTAVSNANAGKKGGGYISVGEEVKFFVTSDIPLNRADETKLSRELSNLHARDGDFLIHLGDINSASTSLCTFSVYDDAAALLKQSPIPVLVLPGNNDWNECPMPEAAFEYWEEKFGRFENNFDVEQLPNFPSVNRQMGRDENFAFLHKGVLFIGVHVVDGTVQSEREWSIRDTENLQWVEQQLNLYDANEFRAIVLLGHAGYSSKVGDFFWPAAEKFKLANKPVLYLHANDGDGMIEYHPVSDFKKFTAVRVEKGSKVASTQIVVGGGMKPFSYVVRAED